MRSSTVSRNIARNKTSFSEMSPHLQSKNAHESDDTIIRHGQYRNF